MAGQHLIYMVTQHPSFNPAASLVLCQSLKQAIIENDVVRIEDLILRDYKAAKALVLDISIH